MSEKINGNDPIQPIYTASGNPLTNDGEDVSYLNHVVKGLTKREYFAAIALQGLISSTDWNVSSETDGYIEHTANLSAKMADALIIQLSK